MANQALQPTVTLAFLPFEAKVSEMWNGRIRAGKRACG
jgi:hypothetical protein